MFTEESWRSCSHTIAGFTRTRTACRAIHGLACTAAFRFQSSFSIQFVEHSLIAMPAASMKKQSKGVRTMKKKATVMKAMKKDTKSTVAEKNPSRSMKALKNPSSSKMALRKPASFKIVKNQSMHMAKLPQSEIQRIWEEDIQICYQDWVDMKDYNHSFGCKPPCTWRQYSSCICGK